MSWTRMPAAAVKKGITFKFDGKAANWMRYVTWNYLWSGREYGLLFNDQYFEPAPEVKEALRRLNLQEPHEFDQRKIRLTNAHNMAMKNERLPKEQWTKWDDASFLLPESFYLKPYLDAIEAEKLERANSSGLVPGFQAKDEAGGH
ncbi:Complex III subunit VII [Aphelenchoides bicaudatus]|nr:Complex III subunit VII [Aphelenchoides bicaudatus]